MSTLRTWFIRLCVLQPIDFDDDAYDTLKIEVQKKAE